MSLQLEVKPMTTRLYNRILTVQMIWIREYFEANHIQEKLKREKIMNCREEMKEKRFQLLFLGGGKGKASLSLLLKILITRK